MRRSSVALGPAVVLCCGLWAAAAEKLPDPTIESIQSKDMGTRTSVRRKILQERKQLVEHLIRIVGIPEEGDTSRDPAGEWYSAKHVAIEILGDLRADEAVTILIDNLDYEVKPLVGGYGETTSLPARFPAAQALVEIGVPASSYAVQVLESTQDIVRRKLCLWVLLRIEGSDETKRLLRLRLHETMNRAKKLNLKESIALSKKGAEALEAGFANSGSR